MRNELLYMHLECSNMLQGCTNICKLPAKSRAAQFGCEQWNGILFAVFSLRMTLSILLISSGYYYTMVTMAIIYFRELRQLRVREHLLPTDFMLILMSQNIKSRNFFKHD